MDEWMNWNSSISMLNQAASHMVPGSEQSFSFVDYLLVHNH